LIYRHPKERGGVGIAVEGITDVWRFGRHSFATFGIGYTRQQVQLISKVFQRVAVCFDGGETQALRSANQLIADLRFRGVDSFRVDIQGDPGDLDQNEADYIVKQIIK
jgi:DNA primase